MYSPGKAFVVYEMSRHVYIVIRQHAGHSRLLHSARCEYSYLADSTIAGDDALSKRDGWLAQEQVCCAIVGAGIENGGRRYRWWLRTLIDCVPGAAIVYERWEARKIDVFATLEKQKSRRQGARCDGSVSGGGKELGAGLTGLAAWVAGSKVEAR